MIVSIIKFLQVQGSVEDGTGSRVATVFGRWDDSIYYSEGDGNSKKKDLNSSDASLIWRRTKPTSNITRYNLTSFAITLNELTQGLKVDMMHRPGSLCVLKLFCFSDCF